MPLDGAAHDDRAMGAPRRWRRSIRSRSPTFATIRPHVRLNDGKRSIVWPTVGHLVGIAPRWRRAPRARSGACAAVAAVLRATRRHRRALPGRMSISLGALLADVPHCRPVQIIGTASDPDLIDRFDLQRSPQKGPTGIVGVLHDALSTAGLAAASLWAAVPGYAAQVPSAKAALALLERACAVMYVATGDADRRRGGVRRPRRRRHRRRRGPHGLRSATRVDARRRR